MNAEQIAFYVQDHYQEQIEEKELHKTVQAIFDHEKITDSPSLTVIITDNDGIKEMNQRFRGLDKPTDVLAFPAGFEDPDLNSQYLGDVVISFQQAQSQAEALGHTAKQELQLLIVHGILHLLGYDHDSPAEKEDMWLSQNQILDDLGVDIIIEDG